MNTPDSPQNTALLNKLILLVLSLILVCLVLLVVRAYTKQSLTGNRASADGVSAPAEEDMAVIVESPPLPPPLPVRRPATNPVRAVALAPPRDPAADARLADALDGTASQNDSFPSLNGVGVPPITGRGGAVTSGTNRFEIIGYAELLGQPPPEVPIDLGPACGRINPKPVTTRHFVVNSKGGLANVFVYLSGVKLGQQPIPSKPVLLDQVGCMYEPYVLALQVGQRLQIRNSDPEMHNVHATPKRNTEFNFGQPVQGQVTMKVFDKPEAMLRMKCDVHPWMFAYVNVGPDPFFAVTDTNGFFLLPPGLPAGKYMITAMHQKAGRLVEEIDFRPGEPKTVLFQFAAPGASQLPSSSVFSAR